jgi:Yip1 domain
MSVVKPGSAGSSLLGRVKDILLQPSATWNAIDGETASISGLYRNYVIPLAAIPVVCNLIRVLAFGMGSIFGVSFRPSPLWLVVQAFLNYALSLAMVSVLALIIEALAASFGGTRDRIQAFKVAAYAPTASWVAGVFGLFPSLSILTIFGALYSLYLLYLGLPKLMKAPQDKATPYFAVVLVVAIVAGIIIGVLTSDISRMGGPLHVASRGFTDPVTNMRVA